MQNRPAESVETKGLFRYVIIAFFVFGLFLDEIFILPES